MLRTVGSVEQFVLCTLAICTQDVSHNSLYTKVAMLFHELHCRLVDFRPLQRSHAVVDRLPRAASSVNDVNETTNEFCASFGGGLDQLKNAFKERANIGNSLKCFVRQ